MTPPRRSDRARAGGPEPVGGGITTAKVRHRLILRVVGLAFMTGVCLLVPSVGPNRLWVAAFLLVLIPTPLVLPVLLPGRRWMVAQSLLDVLAVVLIVALVPEVWTAGLVVVLCSPFAWSALLGRNAYVAVEVTGLLGLATAAVITGLDGWLLPIAVAGMMVPLMASFVDTFLTHELTAAQRLDDVAQSSSAVFWEVDARTGAFASVSGRVEDVFGHTSAELPESLPALLAEDDRRRWWEQVRTGAEDHFVLECRLADAGAGVTWLRLHVRREQAKGRSLLRGIAFDVTELTEVHEALRRRAETDDLTGLPNRHVLLRELEERVAVGRPFALFLLDLDHFKDVNDTLGHQAGDEFLQSVAGRLRETADDSAVVARMGGDEFAVLVGAEVGLDGVIAVAHELVTTCEAPVEIAEVEFASSASCGVAVAPLHGATAKDLLRRADLAMYTAKRSGVGVHIFEFTTDQARVNRLNLSREAEEALASGQMRLWFQPKVELATGRVVGAEGLLRWHHPDRGVLSPAEFLDVVELSKHRKALCETVISQGCDFLASVEVERQPLPVAVNVSIRDLLDHGFAALVIEHLDRAGVPARLLTLEITERELMDDRAGFLRATEAVRSTGVTLAIDDFGTGHSSLLRLHQLPVRELKIDRSFVNQMASDPEAEIIVRSIIELGRSLGHRVTAEGVDRPREVELLRAQGCEIGQGFLYAPALPLEDFLALLPGQAQPTEDRIG